MKLYRTNDGEWVGTQAEAKNKNVIEVPVDKPGLLEWLNANMRDNLDPVADSPSGGPEAAPVIDGNHCPKCKLDVNDARQRAERMVTGLSADAMAEWMATAPTGKVADVMVAMADRLR